MTTFCWKGCREAEPTVAWGRVTLLASGAGLDQRPRWFQNGVSWRQSYWSRCSCWRWCWCCCWSWTLILPLKWSLLCRYWFEAGDWDLKEMNELRDNKIQEAFHTTNLDNDFPFVMIPFGWLDLVVPFLDNNFALRNSMDFDLWMGLNFWSSSSNIRSALLPLARLASGPGLAMANLNIADEWLLMRPSS